VITQANSKSMKISEELLKSERNNTTAEVVVLWKDITAVKGMSGESKDKNLMN